MARAIYFLYWVALLYRIRWKPREETYSGSILELNRYAEAGGPITGKWKISVVREAFDHNNVQWMRCVCVCVCSVVGHAHYKSYRRWVWRDSPSDIYQMLMRLMRTHYKTDSRLSNIRIVFLIVVFGKSTISYILLFRYSFQLLIKGFSHRNCKHWEDSNVWNRHSALTLDIRVFTYA